MNASTGLDASDLRRRDRWIVGCTAAALAAVSWALLLAAHAGGAGFRRAALLPHGHGDGPAALAAGFSAWLLMMVAMMLPAVMPWVLLFSSTSRRGEPGAPYFPTGLFVAGYFAAWAPYCALAAGMQWLLASGGLLEASGLRLAPAAGGALLLVAGLFQLSPWKGACLRHCRNPMGFFLTRWRDGPRGAFRMGLLHGVFCLGCCWALMAVAFAVGLMNLLWMAGLTVFLALEKIAPGGRRLGQAFGLLVIGWGLWLLGAGT